MTSHLRRWVTLLFFVTSWANAQTLSELEFISKHDHFKIQKHGGKYALDGKSVKLGTFEEFLSLFSQKIEGDCSGTGLPDLTVKAKVGGQTVAREFFIATRMVGDGNACATVNGEGIFFIPLHRKWFTEPGEETITLQSPLKLERDGEVLVQLEKVKGQWRASNPKEYVNWEFLDKFTASLKDFPVTHHAHKGIAEGRPHFTMRSGKANYTFYKVTTTLWLAERPGSPWLIGSSAWTGWIDMEKSQWLDRWASQLTFILDKGKELEARKGTLQSLEGQWSPSIRDVYKQLLLDSAENAELKEEAVKMVRQKPTLENMGLLVNALKKSDDPDLQFAISQALRVRHPKGPLIQPEVDSNVREQLIAEWFSWWKEAQNSKDKY